MQESTTQETQPGSARAWLIAARPATLSAAFVPVFVGSACAASVGGLRWGPALAALFGAFLLQIGSNFANDVFDYEKGADTAERLGPVRAVQRGLLSAGQVRSGMYAVFSLALLLGVYLTYVAGLPVVIIGLGSMVSAVAYTGGPYPLGYHGLGDVFVLLFFGFVAVCGTAFVQVGAVPVLCWPAGATVGAMATAILVVNNVRDRVTDVIAGKRTLVARFGRRFGELEYGLLLLLGYLIPGGLVLQGELPWFGALPCLTLPIAAKLWRNLLRREGRALNQTLVDTARLLLLHGMLFGASIFLSSRFP